MRSLLKPVVGILAVAAIGLAVASGASVQAQTVGQAPGGVAGPSFSGPGLAGGQPRVIEWAPVQGVDTPEEAVEWLEGQGWDPEVVRTSVMPASAVKLYRNVMGPGVEAFLLEKEGGAGGSVEFSPALRPAAWPDAQRWVQYMTNEAVSAIPTSAEIQTAIGVAIEGFCAMKARPRQIRAQVSVGVAEVEGTWESSDVCE